jgi:hypothetical protein
VLLSFAAHFLKGGHEDHSGIAGLGRPVGENRRQDGLKQVHRENDVLFPSDAISRIGCK